MLGNATPTQVATVSGRVRFPPPPKTEKEGGNEMAYRWGDHSNAHKVSADVAGRVMEELADGPGLTAQNLVNVSRPEDAPLHPCFEWNDSLAAERYREWQARKIIGTIEIVREEMTTDPEKPVTVRAFHALRTEETAGYEHIEVILSDEEKSERLMELAKRDMGIFKEKYNGLKKLSKVFRAMDETMEDNK